MMEVNIRQEKPADYTAVRKIIEAAFRDEEHSDQSEGLLVEKLRKSAAFIPELSLVAEIKGELVGHILLTKIVIENKQETFGSLALAPVSVQPGYQKSGIGAQLINDSHRIAKTLGYKSIVLLGHADYYPRFGYKVAGDYEITLPFNAPDENCMVIELAENAMKGVKGMVKYAKEFYP